MSIRFTHPIVCVRCHARYAVGVSTVCDRCCARYHGQTRAIGARMAVERIAWNQRIGTPIGPVIPGYTNPLTD